MPAGSSVLALALWSITKHALTIDVTLSLLDLSRMATS